MKEFINNISEELKENFKSFVPEQIQQNITPTNIFFRIINGSIFLFLLSIYVYIPFIVYMDTYNIFPYDFFTGEGIFAINLFSIYISIFVILMSFSLFGGLVGSLVCSIHKIKVSNILKGLSIFNILVLFLFIVFLTEISQNDNFWEKLGFITLLSFISIIVSHYVAISIFSTSKNQFLSMMISFLFILPYIFFIFLPSPTSQLVSNTLKSFGIGGEISIVIKRIDREKTDCNEGKLIFLSPKNIYFKPIDKKDTKKDMTVILERKDTIIAMNAECKDDANADTKIEKKNLH